ncbi:glycoside hydrolase family 88 protein [Arenibacter sp. F26102]|uniref:glycoside hydrolase family 88 protein n=1 Tax=Arenibacter sp. F26102 TaxID=2926416 RepID=UPI001FF12A39|nr:glycoside hydrolase family 88 protein [Arenibacter sp. F26102]MCK0146489.1 glycoside hydrolase family 88 protein [Arenibacter sp. F26102]
MKRRKFLETIPPVGLGLFVVPNLTLCSSPDQWKLKEATRVPLSVVGSSAKITSDKRIAFGWSPHVLNPDDEVLLKSKQLPRDAYVFLRMTVALEMWDQAILQVYVPDEGETQLGILDIRHSSVLVPYELKIDSKHIPLINKYGIKVKLLTSKPFGFFEQSSTEGSNNVFTPHLLLSPSEKGTVPDFLNCFMSIDSVQAFGWREGTVLDGLWQLYSLKKEERALTAIKDHFDLFFEGENLKYENSRNDPRDNRIDGIESTIPYATLARIHPDHPILKTVIEAWDSYAQENGMVTDGPTVTAEGCYTVAYPMAVIGKVWNDPALKKRALEQLKHRFVLIENGNLNLRYHSDKGSYSYKNWARGAAWTLLGFARTLSELKGEIQDREIINKFKEGVDNAISMQKANGLWNGFMDTDNAPDTSGSAGISAAILIGVKEGFLPISYGQYAEKCWTALQNYLTPDGLLKEVSQDNRGGLQLQQGNYRVIAQMGMGLMAQLYANRE